jgi:serine/threonine protein kinase
VHRDVEELPPIGFVLSETYTVLRQIGRGGMGVFFEARHSILRFEREARAAARLTSLHGVASDGVLYAIH